MVLADLADYVADKISSKSIDINSYVTTDSLLQDRKGREKAQNLPPVPCRLIHYKAGDVLVANIRPYLKKIWFADADGGCSTDVLAFRVKNNHSPEYLYALLIQDSFFEHAMNGSKGSKMPRGDKDQVMRYKIPAASLVQEKLIGRLFVDFDRKININRSLNHNLPTLGHSLA